MELKASPSGKKTFEHEGKKGTEKFAFSLVAPTAE